MEDLIEAEVYVYAYIYNPWAESPVLTCFCYDEPQPDLEEHFVEKIKAIPSDWQTGMFSEGRGRIAVGQTFEFNYRKKDTNYPDCRSWMRIE